MYLFNIKNEIYNTFTKYIAEHFRLCCKHTFMQILNVFLLNYLFSYVYFAQSRF